MQLDADEDGEPFFKPPAVGSAPLGQSEEQPEIKGQHRAQPDNRSEPMEAGENELDVSATAAAEQEE